MIEYPEPAQVGQPYHVNAMTLADGNGLASGRAWQFYDAYPLPAWLTGTEPEWGGFHAAEGTPTEAGTVTVTVAHTSNRDVTPVTFEVVASDTEVTPTPPMFDDDAGTITIPDAEGVAYRLDGITVAPGVITVDPDTTVLVTAEPLPGYALTGDTSWSHDFPGAPAEDPAFTGWVLQTAARVARLMGKPEHVDTLDSADMCVRLVAAYAEGYTRGRGWAASGVPVPGIGAVIAVAAVRLAANPRQVTYYQTGDYSERPAVLAGWTAAEVQVLRRYRRVWV